MYFVFGVHFIQMVFVRPQVLVLVKLDEDFNPCSRRLLSFSNQLKAGLLLYITVQRTVVLLLLCLCVYCREGFDYRLISPAG